MKTHNTKNAFYFRHPFDEKQHVYLYEESNHRWSTLRNFAAKRTKNYKDSKFLLLLGIRGGEWDSGFYSDTIYSHCKGKVLAPHVIYDIEKDKVYRLKMRLRDFGEVMKVAPVTEIK